MCNSVSIKFKPFLLATIFTSFTAQAWCFFFDFPLSTNYDQLSKLIWNFDSSVFHSQIKPTPDIIQQSPIANSSVRVVYNKQFRLKNNGKIASFTANFVLNLSPIQPPSAGNEGVAFIFTADPSPPAGSEGQWLGIVNRTLNGSSKAEVMAIEFDTRKNFPDDIDGNHVGLNLNSIYSIVQKPLSGFGVNLSSIADVFVRVEYDGKNISIYVSLSSRLEDQLKSRVIFHPLNLSVLPDEVYVGFSASTYDHNNQLNWIKSWQFNGSDFDDERKRIHIWVWIIVAVAVLVSLCGAVIFFYWMKRRRIDDPEEPYPGIEDELQHFSIAPRAQKFGLKELIKATGNFDPKNSLGKGGFGTVYKGILMDKEIGVKRVSKDSRQGKTEFIAEVTTIGNLHHKNLVKLIGWCYEKRELLLVYEYMPNGSLDKLIFGDGSESESTPDWGIRRNIICGVAEALDYLHNGCEKTVLHRDVKSSNIMLDSKFEPKLGDFGLAREIRRVEQTHHSTREIAGTRGYMAPETFLTSRATVETDVYAFGVLVLEILCGRKPGNPYEFEGHDGGIADWVWEFQTRGRIVETVDVRIGGEYVEEEMENVMILGLACCHPNPNQRPSMKSVLQVLMGETNPPFLPKERPSFVWPPMPTSFIEYTDNSLSQLNDPLTEITGR